MQVISRFPEGIDILVCGSTDDMPVPHVHAVTAEGTAEYNIREAEYVRGDISFDDSILVEGWLVEFEDDVMAAWDAALSGRTPATVGVLL